MDYLRSVTLARFDLTSRTAETEVQEATEIVAFDCCQRTIHIHLLGFA